MNIYNRLNTECIMVDSVGRGLSGGGVGWMGCGRGGRCDHGWRENGSRPAHRKGGRGCLVVWVGVPWGVSVYVRFSHNRT